MKNSIPAPNVKKNGMTTFASSQKVPVPTLVVLCIILLVERKNDRIACMFFLVRKRVNFKHATVQSVVTNTGVSYLNTAHTQL
jgi:hypothetical protein